MQYKVQDIDLNEVNVSIILIDEKNVRKVVIVNLDTFLQYPLVRGQFLSDSDFNNIIHYDEYINALNYTIKKVKKRTEMSYGAMKKLVSDGGYDDSIVDMVIAKMENNRLINDVNNIEEIMSYQFRNHRGYERVSRDLLAKDYLQEDIDKVYAKLKKIEEKSAYNYAKKIYSLYKKEKNANFIRSLYHRLAYAGYGEDLITKIMDDFHLPNEMHE